MHKVLYANNASNFWYISSQSQKVKTVISKHGREHHLCSNVDHKIVKIPSSDCSEVKTEMN